MLPAARDSYPWTKTENSGGHLSPLKKCQQQSRTMTTKLKITTQKDRQLNFAWIILPTSLALLSTKTEFPSQIEFSLLKRKNRVTNSFSSPFGYHVKVPLNFIPFRMAKLRYIEMARNKEEKQGLPMAATKWNQLQFMITCYTGKPSSIHHWRRN